MFSLSDFFLWLAHGIYMQLDFSSNCMIYLCQKRRGKIYVIWNIML